MEEIKFEDEVRFIPDSSDDPKAFVKVATIINTAERIVRVVAKGLYSMQIEVMYYEIGRYQWHTETISLGVEEAIVIGNSVRTYAKEREAEEEAEEEAASEVVIKQAKEDRLKKDKEDS